MIYICVPSHDEGQTIGVVLWKVRQVLGEASRDYQLLVADDGSSDKTGAVLEPYTRVLPLTVMRTEERRGFAASLEMLLREAVHRSEYPRRDAVVVLQADFTEDPTHIVSLLKRVESGADVVVSNVVGVSKGRLKERLGRLAERLVLRGRGLPRELSDPLAGFHAYRVSALRRAFEEDTTRRLLRYEGGGANAALLRAVVPHARRVDVVEWTPRPERRQRPSRSHPGARLRQAWAFARGQEMPDLIPVAGLAPSSVRTARTSEHAVSAAALREAGVTRPGEEERPRRRRTGSSRNGKARPGVKDGRRARRGDDEGRKKRPAGGDGEEPRKRRSRSPKAETTDPESPRDGGEGGEDAEPRKRRSRRGRRRKSATENGETQAAASARSEAADPEDSGAAGAEEGTPKRRRRGRRGGRRRNGRARNGDGASDAGTTGGTEAPSDGS